MTAHKKWYFGTNTKMYKTIAETKAFIDQLCKLTKDIDRKSIELFVIPSYTSLDQANRSRNKALLKLGAQNMCWEEHGQFTGEISPLMLKEVGCELVMLGHSERRHIFSETNEMERLKVRCAIDHNLIALLCIGETEEEKKVGCTDVALKTQLEIALMDIKPEEASKLWIAYEPVWAIGVNGKYISVAYADERLYVIRRKLVEMFGEAGKSVPLLYGGSVNNQNALLLAQCREINGLFIGRSAWDADNFNSIIRGVLNC